MGKSGGYATPNVVLHLGKKVEVIKKARVAVENFCGPSKASMLKAMWKLPFIDEFIWLTLGAKSKSTRYVMVVCMQCN